VLAVLAGLLPPVLFLTCAFRQSAALVERDLNFVGEGSLIRAEALIDSVTGTLRKVASVTNNGVSPETVATLRQAVFLNRSIETIQIRRGNEILCLSEDGLNPKMVTIVAEQGPVPKLGEFVVRPLFSDKSGDCSVRVIFCYLENTVFEALVDPEIFNEFFDCYAREIGIRVFILFGTDDVLTSFGMPGITLPPRRFPRDGRAPPSNFPLLVPRSRRFSRLWSSRSYTAPGHSKRICARPCGSRNSRYTISRSLTLEPADAWVPRH
jgi:hypothetical protein